jgi:FG-GAP-like repeat
MNAPYALRATAPSVLVFALVLVGACAPPDPGRTVTEAWVDPTIPVGLWVDRTNQLIGSTGEWTNKVELADLDGDGRLDILFANGGNYSDPGDPEENRAFLNRGAGRPFADVSDAVFGSAHDLTRVIKARDLNGDGTVDLFVGNTFQTRSRLLTGLGEGRFRDRSAYLPSRSLSLGDAEMGDVDGDGDLDLVLADWGSGNNMTNAGGRTRLWLNDGRARFTDVTASQMPATLIRFSWDLEFVDVDNDYDLDIVISCKRCAGSTLFRNDGAGTFEEDARAMPAYTNNYEFEAMDLDGDAFLDLVTINDGEIVGGRGASRREHVFQNNGEGRFRDMTDTWWPDAENIGEDDNVVAYLDYDSDGDADFLIGSLSGPDRLLMNDGTGRLRTANAVFEGEDTPGTLGMAIGDLDGDGRIDVVQAQGEHPTAIQERIHLGVGLAPDTAPPVITMVGAIDADGALLVRARVHDRKSPTLPSEWQSVEVAYEVMGATQRAEMTWYGEYLWWARIAPDAERVEVCATDASGNSACVPYREVAGEERND